MRTKPKDTLYCGVRQEVIENADPTLNWENIHHFKTFVIERYRIHKRKDVKQLPQPWTKNPILQEFKFTNVRREHDRQTKYLINNITLNPDLSLEDKMVNSFLFRAWNNWSTLQILGFPYHVDIIYSPKLKINLRSKFEQINSKQPDRLWYNNAYNQGGTKCAWKFLHGNRLPRPYKFGDDKKLGDPAFEDYEPAIPLRPLHVGVWLGEDHVVDRLLASKDQQEAFNTIKTVRGFAEFLAYQVFVDLSYIEDFPFSENEFVVAGPGCKRGLDSIFIDRDGMTYEESIFWLRDRINNPSEGGGYSLFNNDELTEWEEKNGYSSISYDPMKLFSDLPKYDRCMNVMSIENCMCELSKYLRAVNNTGRPRNKYKPTKED